MAKEDLNRVPDGGVLRTLDNGLQIIRRKKHEWSDGLAKLSAKKLKDRTGKGWGSKFLSFWTLEALVDRIETAAILPVGPATSRIRTLSMSLRRMRLV